MLPDTTSIYQILLTALPDARISHLKNAGPSGQDSLITDSRDLPQVMLHIRDFLNFDLLSNVTGIDWPQPAAEDAAKNPASEGSEVANDSEETHGKSGFLEVVYHLYSTTNHIGPLVLRARTADRNINTSLPSLVSIFRSAEFQEREVFDLFGVRFIGHPDLRRILMWDEFVDHPMRKDYVSPDDHEYEPTPHDDVLAKAQAHYSEHPECRPNTID